MNNKDIVSFYNYLKNNGYEFHVEESNNKYVKRILELGEPSPINNSCYYKIDNKWGSEYRVYFNDDDSIPDSVRYLAVDSYGYGGNYSRRINDNHFIDKLIDLGLRIGKF